MAAWILAGAFALLFAGALAAAVRMRGQADLWRGRFQDGEVQRAGLESAAKRLPVLEAEAVHLRDELKSLTILNAGLQKDSERVHELERDKTLLTERIAKLSEDCGRLDSRLQEQASAQEKVVQQHKLDLEQMEKTFQAKFENLATRIFDDKTSKFKQESEASLGQLLGPLKERLDVFQKKVDESFGNQAKEQFSLKNEIARIVLANEKITLQAENLTKALKGESKIQGDWGEEMLDRILEDSGLRKGEDYIEQGVNLNLKHPEDGHALKPDVIVKLPDDKHIVIDSKVSLTHYAKYYEEPDEGQREIYLRQFVGSMKQHVNDLQARRYQDVKGLSTPDFVLMFVPNEPAYFLAMQQDKDLHRYAWDKKIIIVCPTNLFATLRTVASIWRIERHNKYAQKIAQQGGDLYDKIVGFVEDLQKVGGHIRKTQESYESAFKKLSTGQGNVLNRAHKLRELGVRASKKLPDELLGDAEHDDSIETQARPLLALDGTSQ